jgi:hypothetical protein
MVYIMDPNSQIYARHATRKLFAISEAVRKYERFRPVIKASVMREIWIKMKQKGFTLFEFPDKPLE